MAIKTRKPVTPSSRFKTFLDTSDLTKKKPEKSLVTGLLKKKGGRNVYGRITCRHKGGGALRRYRLIDFKRSERDVPGKIVAVEYDPNRNVSIALVHYENGAKHYMLMPQGLSVGSKVLSGRGIDGQPGNALPLRNVPVGFMVHNIEINPGSGGTIARSAGASAQIMGKDDVRATLKMPSGEIRMIDLECWATIGTLGNAEYKNITIGSAGRSRHLGIRPTVRGMAMNPVDHPHGGGEGRSKSGSHPVSPWGKGAKGTRTRKRKNPLIIRRRK